MSNFLKKILITITLITQLLSAAKVDFKISDNNVTRFTFVHLPNNTADCATNLMAGTFQFSHEYGTSYDATVHQWALDQQREQDTDTEVASFLIVLNSFGLDEAINARKNSTVTEIAKSELKFIGDNGGLQGVIGCEEYVVDDVFEDEKSTCQSCTFNSGMMPDIDLDLSLLLLTLCAKQDK
ncbi:hypothetical protein ACO0SA_004751 [Hanseniaspora valbyensis]